MVLKLGLRVILALAAAVAASAIDRLEPKAVVAGSKTFTLKVHGEELGAADLIRWKRDDEDEWQVPRQRFVNDRLFELEIPAAWVALPGSATVEYEEGGGGGGGGYTPPGTGQAGLLATGQPRNQDGLRFEILPRSSVPVAQDDSTQTLPGVPVVINVVANDSIPNGLPNRAVSIRRGARNGFVRPQADSTVQYEPNPGFEGEDSFAYRVMDVFGLQSREADVRITVSTEGGFTGCLFSPANEYLPTHNYQTHILNPPRHPPHRMTISLLQSGAPVTEPQSVMVMATKTAILDDGGLPSLTSTTLQTDASGRAVLLYAPPNDAPYDQTEFEATWNAGGMEYTCKGMSLTGMGTLTSLWRSLAGGSGVQAAVQKVEKVLTRDGDGDISQGLDRYSPRMLAFAIAQSVGFDEERMSEAGMRLGAMGERGQAVQRELANRKMLGLLRRSEPKVESPPRASMQPNYRTLPMVFEPNRGQADNSQFVAQGPGYRLSLAPREALLATSGAAVKMRLAGANPEAKAVGLDNRRGRSHYLIGRDPKAWLTDVPQYGRVKYEGVYPGVDIVYYGKQRELEYDLVVAPGARLDQIALAFEGVDRMDVTDSGDLLLDLEVGQFRLRKPFLYQPAGGEIAGAYRVREDGLVGFEVAAYDPSEPLVIDPVLSYSSYAGGDGQDATAAVALGTDGSIYLTGSTSSLNFPTANPLQQGFAGGVPFGGDVVVMKLSPDGSEVVYSTYIGGSAMEAGADIAVDAEGNAYVTGTVRSADFPTLGALQPMLLGSGDVFVLKLNAEGSALVYSTYMGGSSWESGNAIAVGGDGRAYVAGQTHSSDFPVWRALQETHGGGSRPFDVVDAFVAKLNVDGSGVEYATYLGGYGDDLANGIAVDTLGRAYVAGATNSPDFPVTDDALDTRLSGTAFDAFAVKIDTTAEALLYSTYLGGAGSDYAMDIALDGEGKVYVTGITGSADFPLVAPAQDELAGGGDLNMDAFAAKLNADGSALEYSTYLGGSGVDSGFSIAVGADGSAYVGGETDSMDFPAVDGFQAASGGMSDGFVVKLNAEGSAITYSTYLGGSDRDSVLGIAVDSEGTAHVTGPTFSGNVPVTSGALQTSARAPADAFVAKLADAGFSAVSSASFSPAVGLAPEAIASGFGQDLSPVTLAASETPFPTELAGVSVRITDSAGGEHAAPLVFVAPEQINFIVAGGVALGEALFRVLRDGVEVARGRVRIDAVAPGLYSADKSGSGVAAAFALRVAANGGRTEELLFNPADNQPVPLSLGPEGEQVFLLLFGTGIRGFEQQVTATVGDLEIALLGAVAQGQFAGLDQVNIGPLPRSLAGRGEVDIVVTVDGKVANVVTVAIQ